MTRPFYPAPSRVGTPLPEARPTPWTVRNDVRRELRGVRTRRYEIRWLGPDGSIEEALRVAPALRPFEDAVSAMRQGTLLQTSEGPRAVEDLLPGDIVETADGRHEMLLWTGSMTAFATAQNRENDTAPLIRISSETFGLGRPMPDLVLGEGARLLLRAPGCSELCGTEAALAPISSFLDGNQVIGLRPPSPVKVYHVAFARHCVIRANGVELESFHPGNLAEMRMARDLLVHYLTLFPHVRTLEAFGPSLYPQLSHEDASTLRAA